MIKTCHHWFFTCCLYSIKLKVISILMMVENKKTIYVIMISPWIDPYPNITLHLLCCCKGWSFLNMFTYMNKRMPKIKKKVFHNLYKINEWIAMKICIMIKCFCMIDREFEANTKYLQWGTRFPLTDIGKSHSFILHIAKCSPTKTKHQRNYLPKKQEESETFKPQEVLQLQ